MARIRTIKPEFFTSEDIVSMTPLARLLYIALWCESDKEGRLEWKPRTFKMRYMPADDCDINSLCDELVRVGLVRLYGSGLAYIPCFSKHQHVNPRESASDLPPPDGAQNSGPRKIGKNTREAVLERDGHKCVRCGSDDHLQLDHILPQSCSGPHIAENLRVLCRSCNAGRPVAGKALDEDLLKDGFTVESLRAKFGIDASIPDLHAQVGRERKGKEGDMSGEPDVLEVLSYLNQKAKRDYRAVDSNLRLIAARLGEGATVSECKAVVDAKVKAWLTDPKMSQYLRPETLFNATKFAQYVGELGALSIATTGGEVDPRWKGAK